MKYKVYLILIFTVLLTLPVYAEWLSGSSYQSSKIIGYPPYQASIGAKLHTPSILNEQGRSLPTVGSIIYIPSSGCEDLNNSPFFRFIDLDGDPCAIADHELTWYKIKPISGDFSSITSWEDLMVTEMNKQTHPDNILTNGFIPESRFTSALLIPPDALGYRIGFTYRPKSEYGLPMDGSLMRAWDIGYFWGQSAPPQPGALFQDTPSFKLDLIDEPLANAGGVVRELPEKPKLTDVSFKGHFLVGTQIQIQYTFIGHHNGITDIDYQDVSRFWWGNTGETIEIAMQEFFDGPTSSYSPTLTSDNLGELWEVTVLPLSKDIKDNYLVIGDLQTFEITVPQKIGEFTLKMVDPTQTAIGNGRDMLDYVVTLKDTRGFPIENEEINLSASALADFSENRIYTDANGLGKVSVKSLRINFEITATTKSGEIARAPVKLIGASSVEITLTEETVKAFQSIAMKIQVKDGVGNGMPFMPVTIITQSSRDRQNRVSATTSLRFNGQGSGASFTTNDKGELTLYITETTSTGRRTTFQVLSHNAATAGAATFTVVTSPDSEFAQNWGHMPEVIQVTDLFFTRPKLFEEFKVGVSSFTNLEYWGKFTFKEAQALCGDRLPTIEQLTSLHTMYPKSEVHTVFGWPIADTSPTSFFSHAYWSKTESSEIEGYLAIEFENGEIMSYPIDKALYVTCLE